MAGGNFLFLSHCETMIRKLIKWAVVGDGMSSRIPPPELSTGSEFSAEKRFQEHTQLLKHRSQLDVPEVAVVGACQATAAYTKVAIIALSPGSSKLFIIARRAFTFQRHRVKKSSRHGNRRTITLKGSTRSDRHCFFGFNTHSRSH